MVKISSGRRLFLIVLAAVFAPAEPGQADDLYACAGETVTVRGKSLFNGEVAFTALLVDGEYRLVDCTRQIFTFDMGQGTDFKKARHFTSRDGYFGSSNDRAAVSVHWAAQKLYDFYLQRFGWTGYSNKGAPLTQYVHYGKNYFNAMFDKGTVVYGDGGDFNSRAIVSADYVGHEVTHGVTLSTANLIYQGESAALSESFSDIFAKVFEHQLMPERADNWDMFTDIYRDRGMSTRSMGEPRRLQLPKDRTALKILRRRAARGEKTVLQAMAKDYLGPDWSIGTGTRGGTYINAGVQNHWFYLLANGGEGQDLLKRPYDIKGIGEDKAAAIAWRNLTVYLKPDADYLDARYGSEQAAIDLFGDGSPEHKTVIAAWKAVSVVPANYRRLARPDRNFIAFELMGTGQKANVDAAAGADLPHPAHLVQPADHKGPNSPWLMHSSSSVHSYVELLSYQNWRAAKGRTYEIRFTKAGGKALFEDASGSRGIRDVPFEVWDIGASPTSDRDDVRFIPIVFDIDKDGTFGIFSEDKSPYGYQRDHPVLPGPRDYWTDMIHIAAPKNIAPGQAGYRSFVGGGESAIGERHLNWLSFIQPASAGSPEQKHPSTGQTFRIVLSKNDRMIDNRRPQPVPLQ